MTQLSDPYSVWNAVSADAQVESIYLSSNNGPVTYSVEPNTGTLTIAPKAPAPTSSATATTSSRGALRQTGEPLPNAALDARVGGRCCALRLHYRSISMICGQ